MLSGKEPGQREKLYRIIAASGCDSQIEVLGLVSGKEKDKALETAHCLVLPSYGEGLPVAILEAMGHGRAIIATRVGAIPELITDGREGFLIQPGDVEALAERMALLSADGELVRRMGLAARRRVEQEYRLEVMARKVLEIYVEVLEGVRGSGRSQEAV